MSASIPNSAHGTSGESCIYSTVGEKPGYSGSSSPSDHREEWTKAHIPTDGLQCVWGCCVLSYWLPH
uniref:Uncharacterized protein n=1 Tax=Anguilla anguilla TaxID=7936 RepID=A0A0E9V0P3_ANGAN